MASCSDSDTQEYDAESPPSKRLKTHHDESELRHGGAGDFAPHFSPRAQESDAESDVTCPDGIVVDGCAHDRVQEGDNEYQEDTLPYDDIYELQRQDSGESGGFEPVVDNEQNDDDIPRVDALAEQPTCESLPSLNKHTDKDDDENSTSSESLIQQSVEASSVQSEIPGPSGAVSKIRKIASVARDAENIGQLFGLEDTGVVYNRLKQLRDKGNRTDMVTNEILETGLENFKEKFISEDDEEWDSGIFDEIDDVKNTVIGKSPKIPMSNISPDEVFLLLESNQNSKDRVSVVADILIKKYSNTQASSSDEVVINPSNSKSESTNGECDIFQSVEKVLLSLPQANPNEVYNLLEANDCDVQKVVNIIKCKSSASSPSTSSTAAATGAASSAVTKEKNATESPDDLGDNPLYKDMKLVASLLPHHDKNEIYAYLEAHYHRADRVQVVTEELLRIEQNTTANGDVTTAKEGASISQIELDMAMLKKVFPECDPNYIFEQLENMANVPDRVNQLSSHMFERKDYPKLRDRLEQEQRLERVRKLQTMELDIEEFLEMFPNPEEMFRDNTKEVTHGYKRHAETQLLNDFPMLSVTYVRKKMNENKDHYFPTRMELTQVAEAYARDPINATRSHKRFLVTQRHVTVMPDMPDELFYKELMYAKNKERIQDHIQEKQHLKTHRLEEARRLGELYECTCCYDDVVLFEDMLACPEGHLFCKECVRRQAEENIGQAKTKFPCLDGDCELEFAMSSLRSVLSAKNFSILLRRIQEEEIRQADIEDLISCPFCSFATIMDNPDDKVFKCRSPDCLKESCRLCKEPNHIPLRCNEVEKEAEKDMRAYIERRMTEAMIRVCWQCKKRFYKIEGCNKMTCTCGASMCYVCREPITGYEHFNEGNCSNAEHAEQLHQKEMEAAAEEARREYERDHPEAAGTTLKHDPTKLLEKRGETRHAYGDYDEMSEEEDYTDSDYSDDYY